MRFSSSRPGRSPLVTLQDGPTPRSRLTRTNTHAWAGGGGDPLRPPRCRRPGVLRRHSRLMNPRDVRVLLFASRRDDVARTVGTEALRRLAFVAGGNGGARVRRTDQMGPCVVWGRGPADAGVDCADVLWGGGLHGNPAMEGGALAARLPVIPTSVRQGCGGRGGGERRGGSAASSTRACWSGPGGGRPRRGGAGRPPPIPAD